MVGKNIGVCRLVLGNNLKWTCNAALQAQFLPLIFAFSHLLPSLTFRWWPCSFTDKMQPIRRDFLQGVYPYLHTNPHTENLPPLLLLWMPWLCSLFRPPLYLCTGCISFQHFLQNITLAVFHSPFASSIFPFWLLHSNKHTDMLGIFCI